MEAAEAVAQIADRVTLECPPTLCLYRPEAVELSIAYLNRIDHFVFERCEYVLLDFSELTYISAAAALVLFAKVTRCQCTAPLSVFKYPTKVITIRLPQDPRAASLIRKTGLYAALKPGGEKKLVNLWDDKDSLFRSGINTSSEIESNIRMLTAQFNVVPKRIVAAIQEAYLNIAYHAYGTQSFFDEDRIGSFMRGRSWQYAVKIGNQTNIIIYDMGVGIAASMSKAKLFAANDSAEILHAMSSGVTSSPIQGRGMGFDNIKKPIDINSSAKYLAVYSGFGRVLYQAGHPPECRDHAESIGGTLIEWIFLESRR